MPAPKNDLVFAEWVDRFSLPQGGMEVTLFVNGMIISGRLIGAADFLHGVADMLEAGGESDAVVAEVEAGAADVESADAESRREIEQIEAGLEAGVPATAEQRAAVERLSLKYVHLRDASALMSSGIRLPLPFWRGRLSEVAGWTVGSARVEVSRGR